MWLRDVSVASRLVPQGCWGGTGNGAGLVESHLLWDERRYSPILGPGGHSLALRSEGRAPIWSSGWELEG